jgi:SAM-dependent methyltransferase
MQTEISTIEKTENQSSGACGCGSGGCGCHSPKSQSPDIDQLPGKFQMIHEGDFIVEFGSGTGNDAVFMSKAAGNTGKVIGIDNSLENIRTAQSLIDSLKLHNVEFRHGDIEFVPVSDEVADIIYCTCVFNLQQDKQRVADELYRVVKHNGYVCVSDFVLIEDIPDGLRKDASSFAGCIGGAEKVDVFMDYFKKTGFTQGGIVEVQKVKLPDEMLEKHLTPAEIERYNDLDSDAGIYSVVLVVEKPETCTAETCCHNPDKHKHQH